MRSQRRGVEIRIASEGHLLEEYQQIWEDEKIITCIIPSEVGKMFDFKITNFMNITAGICCYIDGMPIQQDDSFVSIYGGARNILGSQLFHFERLLFQEMEVIDEPVGLEGPDLSALGTIEFHIYRAGEDSDDSDSSSDDEEDGVPDDFDWYAAPKPITEDSKKGWMHSVDVKFKPHVSTNGPAGVELWDDLDDPHYIYKFLYRPTTYLQAKGIIPQEQPEEDQDHEASSQSDKDEAAVDDDRLEGDNQFMDADAEDDKDDIQDLQQLEGTRPK
ncbi:uncharacterized protein B0H18DRAFT_951748 [Fomitopsis serialis]|uniref:uncharacterized protein n=1 Tax=Fomitopsis serialis TaxID=139415 RepID=UPI002007D7D6|nr:uncharacterized protein B0H18DRAFT_951748 [Neoantrodia serialis]KAH9933746.1 hypothetical protein B0H18DRAFT_951748 [Neoantrodia serialis]